MVDVIPSDQIQALSSLIFSNITLQIQLVLLVVGLVIIFSVYFRFSNWIRRRKFSYTSPHLSLFVRKSALAFFALALVSTINFNIQIYESLEESKTHTFVIDNNTKEIFTKILNTVNILVMGYVVSQIIPIILKKHDSQSKQKEDFENWKKKKGFSDDPCGRCDACSGKKYGICENKPYVFYRFFKWVPPTSTPKEFSEDEFTKHLSTKEGQEYLENYRSKKGTSIGSYESIVSNPFQKWNNMEKKEYERYLNFCRTGNNAAGRKLGLATNPPEVYTIEEWREMRRLYNYEYIIPGGKPPGYYEQKQRSMPRSINQVIPIGIFAITVLGTLSWWGIDLVVLATATGGLGIGVGLALKQTMENYFAYIIIRKDKIIQEGDRIQLNTGFNGYVHMVTPRMTYIRDSLNESIAIIPTNHLMNEQILNFTKEFALAPALVQVGVSYLNEPKQVAAILMKIGRRVMNESIDEKGQHLVVQKSCPYTLENRPSCGCDQNILVDIDQPIVRFDDLNESILNFKLFVYARDYGSRSKAETDMRMIMYEEFKNYNIKIPQNPRTIYHRDEQKEIEEISKLDMERKKIKDEFGLGDISDRTK